MTLYSISGPPVTTCSTLLQCHCQRKRGGVTTAIVGVMLAREWLKRSYKKSVTITKLLNKKMCTYKPIVENVAGSWVPWRTNYNPNENDVSAEMKTAADRRFSHTYVVSAILNAVNFFPEAFDSEIYLFSVNFARYNASINENSCSMCAGVGAAMFSLKLSPFPRHFQSPYGLTMRGSPLHSKDCRGRRHVILSWGRCVARAKYGLIAVGLLSLASVIMPRTQGAYAGRGTLRRAIA